MASVATIPPSATSAEELTERILAEGSISLSAAARLLGSHRQGRPTHPSTISRWAQRGYRLPGGQTVRLEAVRVCGKLVTSRPAVIRFIAAQQPASTRESVPPVRTPAQRQQAAEAAARSPEGSRTGVHRQPIN